MIDEVRITNLVPHAGSMCLLEWVIDWDESQIRAGSLAHRRPEHPLRREGRIDPVILCEYGAQAMAAHGGLLARRVGLLASPGFLVSLREVRLAGVTLERLEGPLEVSARRLYGDAHGWQYAFAVHHAGQELAVGRAAVVLRQNVALPSRSAGR